MSSKPLPEVTSDDLHAIAQWVFMNTMVDLEMRIENPAYAGHRYHMLGISPLLRKLLIDGGNLVDRVNRRYQLKLEFEMVPFNLSDLECYELVQAVTPGPIPPLKDIPYWRIFRPGDLIPRKEEPGVKLSLAHFLAAHVGIVNGHRISVRELVKFYCIVEGGVHIGDPRKSFEKDLLRTVPSELLQPMHGVNGSPIGVLHPIVEIVKKTLLPLMRAVQEDPAPLKSMDGFKVTTFGEAPYMKWWDGPDLNRES